MANLNPTETNLLILVALTSLLAGIEYGSMKLARWKLRRRMRRLTYFMYDCDRSKQATRHTTAGGAR